MSYAMSQSGCHSTSEKWRTDFPLRRGLRPLLILALCGMTSAAWGVEVSEPRWGFDGKVRPQRFNLLTVTVDNPSNQPAEFDLVLHKTLGINTIDAPLVEPVYLAPGTRRTVQFYPFVTNDWGAWRISWERDSINMVQPNYSRRGARVLLESTDVVGESKGSLRRFPVNQFPTSVTGTDTLQAVVLDHAPSWDEARRQAFLDWIYRGGTVLVLQGTNGKFPEFPAALHQFNAPLDSIRSGAGLIRKLPQTRVQFTREAARAQWRQLPNRAFLENTLTTVRSGNTALVSRDGDDDDEDEDNPNRLFNYSDGGNDVNSLSFLEELKKMTRPDHNWTLLHFMFWVYIALIFPGCYLMGKQRNDFRVVYLSLIGIVLVFSLAFGIVGQRGYGEDTTVDSVAIVQPLPDGQLDVAQWSNAFVTSGAMYDIRHQGTGAVYSPCQDTEAVNLFIKNGAEALFRVDIPPFSSREFAHRIKVAGTLPSIKVERSKVDETGLKDLVLSTDNTFPPVKEMYVLYRDRFYSVIRKDHEISFRSNVGSVPAFLRVDQNQTVNLPFGYGEDNAAPEVRYQRLFAALATRSLNIRSLADAQAVHWSPDRVRLMYYADLMPSLAVQNPRFANQKGRALYCVDLPLDAGASSPNADAE